MARCSVLTCDNESQEHGFICKQCGDAWVEGGFQENWVPFLIEFDPRYKEVERVLTAYVDLQFEVKD